MKRIVKLCTNPDKIIRAAFDDPITMNGVILSVIDSNDSALDEVAHIIRISRVFASHNLNEDVRFAKRWS